MEQQLPSSELPLDPKIRLDLTKKLLDSIRVPQTPPENFDPLQASDEALKLYGLPPRPNKATQPQRFAKWEKLMAKPFTFISPTFEIVENYTKKSSNWCGAVNTNLADGDSFADVDATWTVPNPLPVQNADGTYKDGKYKCVTWVGIDGSGGSHDVLQCGTAQVVEASDGEKKDPSAYFWYEWYPTHEIKVKNFTVNVGDSVYCWIEAESSTKGQACCYNNSSGDATRFTFDAPKGTELVGNSAEWIMEDPSHSHQRYPMPNFGTFTFTDCFAETEKLVEKDLSDANVEIMVQGGETICLATVTDNETLKIDYKGS